jgi:hypothetical protein
MFARFTASRFASRTNNRAGAAAGDRTGAGDASAPFERPRSATFGGGVRRPCDGRRRLENVGHNWGMQDDPWPCDTTDHLSGADVETLRAALEAERGERRRAQCLASIQSGAVQLALDLLVREPDIDGFFGMFTKTLTEECESHACGVWLIDEDQQGAHLWMAYLQNQLFTRDSTDWEKLSLPRGSMASHLFSYTAGWSETVEYSGDDARLPEPVRVFNREANIHSVAVAPLVLATRTLGWVALSNGKTSMC